MIDYVVQYQCSFFASNAGLEPTPDTIRLLLDTLGDKGFVPTTVQEYALMDGPFVRPRLQLQFSTSDQAWNIAFETPRVLITHENVAGTNIGTPREFISEAAEMYARILGEIPLIGNRLSYVTSGLLPDMPKDTLDEIGGSMMSNPQFYVDHPPHEWTTRRVSRVETMMGERNEKFNVITDIGRVRGSIRLKDSNVSIDRIQVSFDINTFQLNTSPRFGREDITSFLESAVSITEQISGQLQSDVFGRYGS